LTLFSNVQRSLPPVILVVPLNMLSSLISFIAIVSVGVFAAPTPTPQGALPINISSVVTPPDPVTLRAVYLGYGTQNYTCNATSGTYLTTGTAEAVLLDITAFYDGSRPVTALPAIKKLRAVGKHYYVENPVTPGTVVPMFISWSPRAFFIGTKNATVASAEPTYSVADALLKNVGTYRGGQLADWVVRTDVVGGVVPTVLNHCVAGDGIAIPYKAHYLFYKNT